MKEDLVKPKRITTIQKAICGFLLDEVIKFKGEFYAYHWISVGQFDLEMDEDEAQYYSSNCNIPSALLLEIIVIFNAYINLIKNKYKYEYQIRI